MNTQTHWIEEFQRIEERFNQAMVSNDPKEIAKCITDDWVLINPESGPLSRELILGLIGSGTLAHSSMTKQVVRAKVYGDVAVVTGRGQNKGTFQGRPIEADEWVTDVYMNIDNDWLCVTTQLTPIAGKAN